MGHLVHHTASHMATNHLTRRGDFWQYKRRVPKDFAQFDKRGWVYASTHIRIADDRAAIRAGVIAERINTEVEAYWRGLIAGQSFEAQRQYDAARKRARVLGFTYVPVDELARAPLEEILARLDKLREIGGIEKGAEVAALLGGATVPPVMLSSLVETYENLVRSDIRDLSADQLRKWRNHKKRAVLNLITVIGDKPITSIRREEAMDFRDWWQARVMAEGLDNATANKDIGRLSAMFRLIERKRRLGMTPIFADLRFGAGDESRREAFEPAFIQSRILKRTALEQLNDEARRVIFIMVETGLRPAEIVNLTKDTIILGGKTPHVMVRPDGRRMKTDESRREIPLVGVALAAAKAQPNGFPRYRDKSAALSATINKFLTENGLRPTPAHSLYSIRHTFEDRLTAVEAPEKVIAALMGHKFSRPRYGQGPSLMQKQSWLLKIAFKAPRTI